MPLTCRLVLLALVFSPSLALSSPQDPAATPVDFARDVRPILSDNCYRCHGFDPKERKGGLRLDQEEGAFAELRSGAYAVRPGDVEGSELVQRILAADPNERMPPPDSEITLEPHEIGTLVRWVEEGAQWQSHWSFVVPGLPTPPAVENADWVRNPIDSFILQRLEHENVEVAPEASRATLLRRVTYDLTGLPPTTAELDAFLGDESPMAYEKAVDRLLNSPRYGEHMARYWLDAARYGDTHGLHLDSLRNMWRYREWVIQAMNSNLPFDQFTIEQLAGDLLPEPTLDQLIASGFNRCNVTSAEGGMIADEYLALYAMDRVDTTSTVWLGMSMGCAKCHDHKYDPFSMKDYYQLFGFFNSLAEEASDRNIANPVPFVRAPTPPQEEELASMRQEVSDQEERVEAPMPEVDAAQAVWEADWSDKLSERWRILVPSGVTADQGTTLVVRPDDSIAASGPNPAKEVIEVRAHASQGRITALRLEALVDEAAGVPGRAPNQNFVLTGFEVEAYPPGRPDQAVRVPFVAAIATHSQDKYPISAVLDGNPETGWGGLEAEGSRSAVFMAAEPFGFAGGTELRVRLRHESRFAQHTIARVRLAVSDDPALSYSQLGTWSRIGPFVEADPRKTFDEEHGPESGIDLAAACGPEELRWAEEPGYVDGQVHAFSQEVGSMYLFREIQAPTDRVLRVGVGSDDGIRIWVNGELVHDNPAARGVALDQDFVDLPLEVGNNELLIKVVNYGGGFGFAFRRVEEEAGGIPMDVAEGLAIDASLRAPAQVERARRVYRQRYAPTWIALAEELDDQRKLTQDFENALPTTMISRELPERRQAYVLTRGQYDHPGEAVEPDVPAVFSRVPEGSPQNRLGLARWLMSAENPLTGRVAVNRYWQRFFGIGLVETAEDFGVQGTFPSHPKLLDWMAREFIDGGWDVKAIQRLMVTSATYRQSSLRRPELTASDPYNRLLGRGPRFRLDAEQIRDTALYCGDLLVERIGGPSVRPYQPIGVWKAVGYTSSNTANYTQDSGDALYRRSLYTFWKRTAAPPNMLAFDAPSREACTVRRARTNTPMQALVLLNDPCYVEAARGMGLRIMREGGETTAERLAYAFRTVTSRVASERELEILTEAHAQQAAVFEANPALAAALLEVGESPVPDGTDPVQLAIWAELASLMLNLDEAITRG